MDGTIHENQHRVAFLIDRLVHPNAGTEGQLMMLIDGLHERGYVFELAVFNDSNYVQQLSSAYSVHCLNVYSILSFRSWWRLFWYLRELKKRQFQVLHLYFNDTSIMVPMLGRLMGFRVIVSRRDMGFWYTPFRLKLLKLNRYFTQAMVANSHAVKENACRSEGFPEAKSHVIYNGIFECTTPSRSPDPKGDVHIGLVANIRSIKRIDDLITAVALLKGSGNVIVHIAGDGDPSELICQAKQCGIEDRVYFHGRITDVSLFLESIDISVLCSESEGLSNALIEYMLHQKPIVCSEIAANLELIKHLEDGLVYPVGDVRALADSLEMLIADPQLCRQLALSARTRIQTLCNRETMINQHQKLYRQLTTF